MSNLKVRAKFKVQSVTEFAPSGIKRSGNVALTPVTSGSEENKIFWEYTPSGKIEMQTTNGAALDQFKPGDEFYVDFTRADAPQPAAVDVEHLAKSLYESAVEVGASRHVVNKMAWNELSEEAREGRRSQARHLLAQFNITHQ